MSTGEIIGVGITLIGILIVIVLVAYASRKGWHL